jgi:hypothetical protein
MPETNTPSVQERTSASADTPSRCRTAAASATTDAFRPDSSRWVVYAHSFPSTRWSASNPAAAHASR